MYNPGVVDQSGQLLANGIGGAGDAITAGLEKWKEKSDKAKALRQALSVYMPDQKDQFQAMGLPELEGQVQGLQMQNQARQQQSQQTEQAAKMDLLRAQMVEQNQRVSDQQGAALSLQRYRELNGGQLDPNVQGPPRAPVDDMGTALRNAIAAGVAPRDLSELATASAHLQRVTPGDPAITQFEDPDTHQKFVLHGGTMLPAGVNTSMLKDFGRAHALVDEDGNPIGRWAVQNAKGGLQLVSPPTDRSAADAKANIGSLFVGEKVLKSLDDDILDAENTNAAIKKAAAGDRAADWAKGRTPIPPERFDELKARRERVKKHLDALDAGAASVVPRPGAAAAGVGAGAGGAPRPMDPSGGGSSAGAAELVRAAFKAGKISKEQALEKLRGLGYGD